MKQLQLYAWQAAGAADAALIAAAVGVVKIWIERACTQLKDMVASIISTLQGVAGIDQVLAAGCRDTFQAAGDT